MPRVMDALLRQAHERANPQTRVIAEVSAPDVGQVLRRWTDQFSVNPPRLSETPGGSTVNTPSGALTLAASDLLLAQKYVASGTYLLGKPDVSKVIKGVGWTPDPGMAPVILRSFVARIKRRPNIFTALFRPIDLSLQIYRPTAVVGTLQRTVNGQLVSSSAKQWSFPELLPQPAIVKGASIVWDGTDHADITFDLRDYALEIGPFGASPLGGPVEEKPYVIFQVSPVEAPLNDLFDWRIDNTSGLTVAGVGTFRETTWSRSDPNNDFGWKEEGPFGYVECFKLNVLDYVPTSQLVYAITLPAVPTAPSTGRIVFERSRPELTTLELSTAGSGGPWTAVTDTSAVAAKQLAYHLRVTLNASADHKRAPFVAAVGIEFRIPTDLAAEGIVEPLTHEIGVPFLEGAIAEGQIKIVRTGRRDYHDPATELAANYPTTKLEADLYLASTHPAIPRSKWLHLDRAAVSARTPVQTSETLQLLSVAKQLKRKIPERIESINKVHTVTGVPTTGQVQVTPNLAGTTVSGNEYDAKGYYLRVRSSSVDGLSPGYIHTIDGNTNVDKLDFITPNLLPNTFAVGDVIEVHSGVYAQPALSWEDEDPAVIWLDILTVHRAIPLERIGRGDLGRAGRSGLPPTVADRAPGDPTTQAKLLVTMKLSEAENGDELLDQVSFIMGGCTTEIAGQIVFRQIYPLRDANNVPVVAPDAPAAVFDVRDYAALDTPPNVEQRITTISCDYGMDLTAANPDQQPTRSTTVVDADAVAWLATQDVDGLGASVIPDKIARWCYNSTDQGLYLATLLGRNVVFAASTGLRVWSWRAIESRPQLCVGDVVVIITDQYTDYDPARKLPIVGTWAFSLVLVSVAGGGKVFRGFMLGLASALQIKGGNAGTLGTQPIALPQLDVVPTQTTTTVEYAYTAVGLVEYRVDAGGWAVAGASPIVVARNASGGATKQVQIRATSAGVTIYGTGAFTVPPQDGSPPARAFTGINAYVLDYTLDHIEVDWFVTGFVSGDYFRLMRSRNGAAYSQIATGITATFTVDNTPGLTDDLVPSGGSGSVTFDYEVEWYDSGNVLKDTSTVATVVSDTA